MPKHKQKCLRCGKEFFTREELYCLQCRLKDKKKDNKHEDHIHVRIVDKKIDLKKEIQGLIFLENRYPEVVEKIRSKKFNSKKNNNNSSEEQ